MAKYSYEFKMKVVEEYLAGKDGFAFLSEKYNISSTRDLQKWVSAYNQFGSDGLMRKRKNQTYSFEFKLHVVELYLTTEVSYQDLAL
ncbi:transposase, partial [Tissierella carlieri]|uniref:helix-turn-helix domain-containing protein n=1 Tax=Tissierella carlieri TaxID=689904 RepID=UPI001C0F4439